MGDAGWRRCGGGVDILSGCDFYADVSSFARGYTHGMTSFHNIDELLEVFVFFEQDYRDLPSFWHTEPGRSALTAEQEFNQRHFGK